MPPPASYALDGLWRCLCPSIDAAFLTRAPQHLPRLTSRPVRTYDGYRAVRQARRLHTAFHPAGGPALDDDGIKSASDILRSELLNDATRRVVLPEVVYRGQSNATENQMCQSLLPDEEPGMDYNASMFEALVKSNWDTDGSAAVLKEIHDRMEKRQILPDSSFYHAALRLLAVHPNYIERAKILRDMKNKNMALTAEGKTSVALGLLRDEQYEMALDYLNEMARDAVDTPAWVFDIFIFVLGKKGFNEEALKLMLQRPERPLEGAALPTATLWYFLMDECSAAYNYRGTRYLWDNMVRSKIVPSDGMVNNVLLTASRHGDLDLAEQAIQSLSQRSVKLGKHHYEALIDCYLACEDAENALRVLAIMKRAAIVDLMESTKIIRHALEHSALTATEIATLPRILRKSSDATPEAEALLIDVLCRRKELNLALEIFKNSDTLQRAGPELHTYFRVHESFLSAPLKHRQPSVEEAALVLSTVERFASYDEVHIVDIVSFLRCYTLVGNDDLRSKCLDLLMKKESGFDEIETPFLIDLVEICLSKRDPRAWDLLDNLHARDVVESELSSRVSRVWRKLIDMRGETERAGARKPTKSTKAEDTKPEGQREVGEIESVGGEDVLSKN
ncbi:hypothetical protein B0T14DRAFT_230672 [Immersiella caudata]|uniref:Pentatricopeptide repeat-containing protein-mitochondrial domain-containing protein n=1 Tax=Immersiella caudata TaxID=314043 RepID=A0AA39WRP7_9PEZI|nr:hypothetical protein B0T14DRAFT_230672 [Immersiella caudata]